MSIENLPMPPAPDHDHTYLATEDSVLFCVSGDTHTADAIYGMPYYLPTARLEEILDAPAEQQIIVGGKEYSKILGHIAIADYPGFIQENLPEYYYSPPGWEVLMKVDRAKIRKVYDPRELVAKIRQEHTLTPDESNPLLYAMHKLECADDPHLIANVGITGSLLLTQAIDQGVRNDIDLIFYGEETIEAARAFSGDVLQSDPRFSGLSDAQLQEYVSKKRSRFGNAVSENQLMRTVEGRFDTIFVDGVKLDFTFSRAKPGGPHPWRKLEPQDEVAFTARVVDDVDSYYLPTRLKTDKKGLSDIVITARGYICLFRNDDVIKVNGQVYNSREDGGRFVVIDEGKGFVALESR